MQDSDSHSFSLISEPGIETIYTPTEQDTDEYDFVFEDGRSVCLQQDDDSSCCTSLAPSMLDYEHSHGRRYHAYLSGRYPLPNDKGEQYRELNDHLLMQQLFVRSSCERSATCTKCSFVGWRTLLVRYQ